MAPAPTPPLCDKCGKVMRMAVHMPPLWRGGEQRTVFKCEPCDAIKWIDR